MDNIVVLDGYTLNPGDQSWDTLEKLGAVNIYDRTEPHQVVERSIDSQIIIVNKIKITKEVLAQLPQLKYITLSATGHDNIDKRAAREKGVAVSNVVGYSTLSVAQHVFAMLFNVTNKTASYITEVKQGTWSNQSDFSYWTGPIIELSGMTLGVYGMGKIGEAVARIAQSFGMHILATSRSERKIGGLSIDYVPIHELFMKSDVISLHAPLSKENYQIVDQSLLKSMKPSAILINTARGGLIHNEHLYQALSTKTIRAACLDVLEQEPPSYDHPLFPLENCHITPHQAWGSLESRKRLMQGIVENIKAFQNGMPQNLII